MNIVLLVVGIIAGAIIGYLTAGRKAAALKTQVEAAEEREALLNRTAEERITRERSIAEERLQEANRQASERLSAQERLFAERISEQARNLNERLVQQERSFCERLAEQQKQWEQRLTQQKEEAEALHKRMNTEFENLSNRIFQSKTEDFTKLNAEHLGNLLRPLDEKIKDFKEKVEQVYSTEAKERFSLGERIKELVELNNRLNVQRQPRPAEFPVILPNGETIYVPVEEQELYPHPSCVNDDWMLEADATVIKDAVDDPDVTNGMQIKANVAVPFRFDDPTPAELGADDYTVIVCGGEGVGIVTLSGLGLEVGGPAINITPRKMIENNVKACLQRLGISKQPNPFAVTISVPGGEEIARRTFNPRLGIEGGISIIGTSGIVKPFSSEAFVDSIRKSMEVGRATGSPRIVLNSGAKRSQVLA